MLQVLLRLSKSSLRTMPATRSATRAAANNVNPPNTDGVVQSSPKRKASTAGKAPRSKKPRSNVAEETPAATPKIVQILPVIPPAAGAPPTVLPAALCFSFEDAKGHMIEVDERFQDVFEKNQCKPFEELDRVEPFRTLVTSILGQQISWMAARSITHKFVRLYDESLPEKAPDVSVEAIKSPDTFFPTAQQVASTDIPTLKSAGLSTRKAEYVIDLAARFADGRLSTQKLIEAEDEKLYELLTAVRGIGRWTVDMFAIFSLRRPNILPVGDLGVQRGVCRWFLSLHAPENRVIVSPQKKATKPKSKAKKGKKAAIPPVPIPEDIVLAAPSTPKKGSSNLPNEETFVTPNTPKKGSSSLPNEDTFATPLRDAMSSGAVELPPAFTPSIQKTLNREPEDPPVALPDGLTTAILKARLTGKKVKGAILTPKEMEELTECWKPYRSLGAYYMWSAAEVADDEE